MDHIEIFPLKEKDCKEVAELSQKNLPENLTEKMLIDALKYNHNHFFTAYDKEYNRILGFAGMLVTVDEAELLYIATDLPYRKKGIGQMLLSQVICVAEKNQANRLLLEVREHNEEARRFYEKNEFVFLALRKNYYNNPVENAIIMERKIDV